MDMGLKGKTAVITASSLGLGKAMALGLAQEGANVTICARRNEHLQTTKNEIENNLKEYFEALIIDLYKVLCSRAKDSNFQDGICEVTESWYHITKTNGMHESHIHPGCSWCGVFYIQSGDNSSGETVFERLWNKAYNDIARMKAEYNESMDR